MLGAVLTSRKPESKSEIQAAITAGLRSQGTRISIFHFLIIRYFSQACSSESSCPFWGKDKNTGFMAAGKTGLRVCMRVGVCSQELCVYECANSVQLTDNWKKQPIVQWKYQEKEVLWNIFLLFIRKYKYWWKYGANKLLRKCTLKCGRDPTEIWQRVFSRFEQMMTEMRHRGPSNKHVTVLLM